MTQNGLRRSNFWVGSLYSDGLVSGATAYFDSATVGSATINNFTAGSFSNPVTILDYASAKGFFVTNLYAETIISGGQWAVGSAASGTSPTPVLKAYGATPQVVPLGICTATAQSGALATVLIQGYYKGLVAEATINVGQQICAGSGATGNCCLPATAAGRSKGICLMGASSGTAAEIVTYLY